MNRIFLVAAIGLLTLSAVQFLSVQSIFLWQLSIITVEFGHWFAMLCVLLLVATRWRRFRVDGRQGRAALAVLSVSTVIFLFPLLQFCKDWSDWKFQIQSVLGKTDASLGVGRLIWGGLDLRRDHEVLNYDSNVTPALRFDFYRAHGNAKAPWVLIVPGGSWTSTDTHVLWELNAYLASQGYAVAVATYRTAPTSKWPAAREDIESAARYIQSHAAELGVDPERWVVLGHSAGGQIAESIAYSGHTHGLRGGIFFYAPSDLSFAYKFSQEDDILGSPRLLRDYLGGTPEQVGANYEDASPLRSVSAKSPPTLLIHGASDPMVWTLHSARLYGKLSENGVGVVWIEIPWATHGFDYVFAGPGALISRYAIDAFLQKVMQ